MVLFRLSVLLVASVVTGTKETSDDPCPQLKNCVACINTAQCFWCPFAGQCKMHEHASCGQAVKKTEPCPIPVNPNDEIYIHSGINTTLAIEMRNVKLTTTNYSVFELMKINSSLHTPVSCDAFENYSLCHMAPKLEANESKAVYTLKNKTVTVYDCSKLAEGGCNYCKALNSSRYKCAWNSTACIFNDTDGAGASATCPPPTIQQMSPKVGPYIGEVTVTLHGAEFGVKNEKIIQSTVKVSGKTCHSIEEDMDNVVDAHDFNNEVRVGFRCRTRGKPMLPENTTTFSLDGQNGQTQVSIYFSQLVWKNTTITRVSPEFGPRSGGTMITLYGANIGIGNKQLEVFEIGTNPIKTPIFYETSVNSDEYVIVGTTPNASIIGNANFTLLLNGEEHTLVTFTFLEDPIVEDLEPRHGFLSGGTELTVTGMNLTNANRPVIFIRNDTLTETPCILKDTTTAYCKVPEAPGWIEQTINSSRGKRAAACVGCHEVEIVVKLDGVERSFNLKYYHDPALSTFNNGLQLFSVEQQYLTIEGNNLQLLAATDVNITIGIAECRIVEIQTNFMRCAAPREQPAPGIPGAEYPEVNVTIGNYQQSLGQLQYEKELNRIVLIAAASAGGATFLFVLAMLIICRKVRQVGSKAKKLKRDLNNLELEIKTVARQEFLDMQTSMSLVNRQLIEKGFPFKPYQSFACTALFGIEHLPPDTNIPDDVQWTGPLQSFEVLLGNKLFLASLIGTMEKQRSFFIREKSNLASNLCLIMMGRMDYLHEVIEDLLTNRVQETSGKRAMKTLFRRCDGITEKLLSNWLLLCLHPHLTGNIGCQLYLLYMATRKTIESGPIDDLTNDSKYTLTEEKLLTKFEGCEAAHGSQDVRFHAETLTLNVVVGNSEEIFPCNALDCDTITQVKVKCLEQIYVNYPASQMQVNPRDLILEWHSGFGGRMVLSDSDNTSIKEGEWVKLNTLAHYNVPDQSNMVLLDPLDHMVEQQEDYVNLARLMDTGSAMDIPLCVGDTGNELETEVDPSQVELKPWHLVKKEEEGKNKGRTIIAELYLNRLLTTKQSLMQYVGNVFGDVLDRNNCPPPAMFLFRFLDNIGDRMNADPNIVHAWKSHSYAIRVLAHLIQSPEMLFDVTKPSYVSDNLDVISQVFIDSFELAEHKFTANSASHKLVFFNEVRDYREKVKEFYANIRGTEFDNLALIKYMNEVNEIQEKTTFDKNAALYRLFMQIKPYSGEIMDDLSSNKITRSLQLHTKLAEILTKVDED
ncbi:hypothetical protein DPMN_000302 [Dreissena polymorpha]|uniref:IPT/TIG domain-containing protein n=1 Tax=Dreissena polymorpha TaxID=45954 RepID=A0A9D4MIQ8_DREPO|nr:hypothetical protein DPMN_000302 [Dreissena polymorpha]